jgi:diadenosine tetraphosphate (Ap4A) HIT family hydrolase
MAMAEKRLDIFDDEKIIGASTITTIGTVRIVASKDADHEFHFLVMTIQYRDSFIDLTETELKDMQMAESLIAAFYKAHGLDSYSKIELVGSGAGRTIPHFHTHFLPGKSDLFNNNPGNRALHRSADQLNEIVSRLRPEFENLKKSVLHI